MTSTFAGPDQPPELLAYHDPDEPWQRWGCPVKGCSHRVVLPWELEQHTATEHPGWAASWEAERMRVVFRLVEGDDSCQRPASLTHLYDRLAGFFGRDPR